MTDRAPWTITLDGRTLQVSDEVLKLLQGMPHGGGVVLNGDGTVAYCKPYLPLQVTEGFHVIPPKTRAEELATIASMGLDAADYVEVKGTLVRRGR